MMAPESPLRQSLLRRRRKSGGASNNSDDATSPRSTSSSNAMTGDGLMRQQSRGSTTTTTASANKSSSASAVIRSDRKVFYANITVLDASGAVYDKVHSKLKAASFMPGNDEFKRKFAETVASKASKTVSPKHVAKMLAEKVPKLLQYKMHHKGLQLLAETVFWEETYLVVQLQIQHVDPVLLAQSAADEKAKLLKKRRNNKSLQQQQQQRLNTTTTTSNNISTNISSDEKKDDDDDNDDVNDSGVAKNEEETFDLEDDDDDSSSVSSSVLDAWIDEQEKLLADENNSADDHNPNSSSVAPPPFVVTNLLDAKAESNNNSSNSANTQQLSRRSCLARWIDWILSKFFPSRYRQHLQSLYLPSLIQSTVTEKMKDVLHKKMISKNVKAKTEVLMEEKQARYFFTHLKEIRGGAGASQM